jgi:predicted RNA-binding protein with PIN domain
LKLKGDKGAISLHIIIDGYNLIRRSSTWQTLDAEDLLLGREALVDQLADYKRHKSHRLTVVFDGGSAPPGSSRQFNQKGIRIRFSRPGETADAMIKRIVQRERERALVVSSDREVRAAAEASGAATIGAADFEFRLLSATDDSFPAEEEEEAHNGWIPTTKKKGPSRRQPRRARFNRKKISKL